MPEEPHLKQMPTFTKIFDDPTPGGIIVGRVMLLTARLLDIVDLTEEEKQTVFNINILVAKKMIAVWKHKEQYRKILNDLIAKEKIKFEKHENTKIEISQDLFLEFDEFLVQLKSCLDYLVHLPSPIFSDKRWNLRTFGDKGRDVIRAFRRNLPKDKQRIVEGLIKYLFERSQEWLTLTIDARDKVNHFLDGGIPFENFSVLYRGEPSAIRVPMWSPDMSVDSFMEVCWYNLLVFVEDFIASMMYFKLKDGLALRHGLAIQDSPNSPWQIRTQADMDQEISRPGWAYI
jgi:hypothetical protein